ncbi:COQ9 family protein [Cognatishimia sp. SS12]|uniref:COQ9 family protein n=1 Tax=Cognatishimia sp. SS12 TaxID=2979465 RepID=UPI00232CB8EA|nr:COQ9 family protein [Cognatishimia sp. SS12]MDC0739162.1 COQ9 family protein [Cognatishimia sp. SS12]
MTTPPNETVSRLVDAALAHVAFDGWSTETFEAAVADSGIAPALAQALCPRGGVDLAAAYHRLGDAKLAEMLAEADLNEMRFRDRVAHAVKLRLQISADKEVVRRGTTLFALPQHAAQGSALIWGTADTIWNSLGDTSRDINWYSKRATLSAVYGATVLYWLGDDSDAHEATWAFLDRRISNVMQIEKAKATFKDSALGKVLKGPLSALSAIKAPAARDDLPGS